MPIFFQTFKRIIASNAYLTYSYSFIAAYFNCFYRTFGKNIIMFQYVRFSILFVCVLLTMIAIKELRICKCTSLLLFFSMCLHPHLAFYINVLISKLAYSFCCCCLVIRHMPFLPLCYELHAFSIPLCENEKHKRKKLAYLSFSFLLVCDGLWILG